jgi:NADPH2:quinone reductase
MMGLELLLNLQYQIKPPLPFSPGSEITGIVRAVGEGVRTLKVGDRVMASCQFGGFAEQVTKQTNANIATNSSELISTNSHLTAD